MYSYLLSCTRTMGLAEQESDNGKKNDHTKNHVDVANCCRLGRQWSPIVVSNAGLSTFGDQRYRCHAIVCRGVVTRQRCVVWPTLLFKGHLTTGTLLVGWTQGANEQVVTCHALRLSLPMSLHLVLPVNQMPSQKWRNVVIRCTSPSASILKNPKLNYSMNTDHIYEV